MRFLLQCILVVAFILRADGAKNILFIMADDMRPEAEPFRGNWGWSVSPDDTFTPNLQRLAAMGTTFQNTYCQFSICGPSRTSLMTGRRPDTTKVYANDRYWRDYYDITTFPQYLKDNGYTSLGLGKIFHEDYAGDGGYDADSWSSAYPFYPPSTKTFWKSEFGHDYSYYEIDEGSYRKDLMDRDIADKAKEYLEQFGGDGTQFIMAVGFKLPHLPLLAPVEFFNNFTDGDLPDNCYVPNDLPVGAFYESAELLEYEDISGTGYDGSETGDCLNDDDTKGLRRAYYASVSYVDSLVGELLDTLEDQGLDKNTAIVFTSDHGYQLGEHKSWNKNTNFEISNHVPLIISDPDKEGGRSTDALVELVDIFPTMVELAGLDQVDLCDSDVTNSRDESVCREGSSLVSLLSSDDNWDREAVFYQFKRKNDMGYTIIKDNYRFTVWVHIDLTSLEVNWNVHEDVYMELYDLTNDPYENTNLATDSDYEDIMDELYDAVKNKGWSSYIPTVDVSNNSV